PVVIDSMNLVNSNELTLSSITYPCTIPSYDSLAFELSVYSDSARYITDTLLIYSNDQYNTLDTMEIQAGTGVSLVLDSAVAKDNRNAQTGIDYDDCVILYFNYPVDTHTISPSHLDSILPLSNGHTWYDGTGSIDRINYTDNNTVVSIWLSTDSIIPTVAVGDTINPDSAIMDERNYSYITNSRVITGSFSPTGISSYPTIDHKPSTIDLTFNYQLSTIDLALPSQSTLVIYDLIGRNIITKQYPKGNHIVSPDLNPGIYFIHLKTPDTLHTQKITILK
ncbi:MAG: T9SS type A sorting domain-containing protein, partial [bacterium]